jgi:4-amino-4-deoxychorismate lyase
MSVLFNGAPIDAHLGATRALHYGDGVFRTMLVHGGSLVDAQGQWAHLARDAARIDLDPGDPDVLRREAALAIDAMSAGVLKVVLSRCGAGRGYAPATRACDRLLSTHALPPIAATAWSDGVDVAWSKVLLGIQPLLAGVKHLNRLEQVLASRDWPEGVAERLLCDAEGRIVCGTRTNVFFVTEGALRTPDLTKAGVAGRMRHRIIELAAREGIDTFVETVAPDEVRHATECFLTNSIIGLWPVRTIGGLSLPAPGPITRLLLEALAHPLERAA